MKITFTIWFNLIHDVYQEGSVVDVNSEVVLLKENTGRDRQPEVLDFFCQQPTCLTNFVIPVK